MVKQHVWAAHATRTRWYISAYVLLGQHVRAGTPIRTSRLGNAYVLLPQHVRSVWPTCMCWQATRTHQKRNAYEAPSMRDTTPNTCVRNSSGNHFDDHFVCFRITLALA